MTVENLLECSLEFYKNQKPDIEFYYDGHHLYFDLEDNYGHVSDPNDYVIKRFEVKPRQ